MVQIFIPNEHLRRGSGPAESNFQVEVLCQCSELHRQCSPRTSSISRTESGQSSSLLKKGSKPPPSPSLCQSLLSRCPFLKRRQGHRTQRHAVKKIDPSSGLEITQVTPHQLLRVSTRMGCGASQEEVMDSEHKLDQTLPRRREGKLEPVRVKKSNTLELVTAKGTSGVPQT
eukprot:1304169-Rhodomonas_salina.1